MNKTEVERKVKKLISDVIKPQKHFNDKMHSYTLKHKFESIVNNYVSNEDCIKWMQESGYEAGFFDDGPNCHFNITTDSINTIRKMSSMTLFDRH